LIRNFPLALFRLLNHTSFFFFNQVHLVSWFVFDDFSRGHAQASLKRVLSSVYR